MLKNFYLKLFFGKMRIFGSVQPKSECNFLFLHNLIFQLYYLPSSQAPTPGGDRHMPSWTFLSKLRCQKLLFEAFFGIMCIFGSVQPKSECNFLFLYKNIKHIIIHRLSWLENGGCPYLYNFRAVITTV